MTGPVTTEALVESLTTFIMERSEYVVREQAAWRAEALVKGPLTPFLAALQQVTAERDEEKARADRNDAKLAEITQPWVDDKGGVWLAPTAWAYAKACGALHQHRDRANAAEASLATVTSELARLQAEGEAKDRRIAALTEALAPFARFADMATPDTAETWAGVHHSFRIGTRFKHEHFRAARAATAREGA